MRKTLTALAAIACLPFVQGAHAEPITSFALFGGSSTLSGNVTVSSGWVGSNGNLAVGSGADTLTVTGGGALSASGNVTVGGTGDVIFNGNVSLGSGALVEGDVHSGGNVSLGGNAEVLGNIYAAGTVTVASGAKVQGNIDASANAGNAVVLSGNSLVAGTITHKPGTSVSKAGTAVAGSTTQGVPQSPLSYTATALPTSSVFTSGGANVSGGSGAVRTIAAGSYGAVNVGGNSILNLSAGSYFFDSWSLGSGTDVNFDLTGGDILLFFTGNVGLSGNVAAFLTGGDASNIYAETHGNWNSGSGVDWFGSIYGSGASSNVTFAGNTTLVGSAWATNKVDAGSGSTFTFELANHLVPAQEPSQVPEPTSLLLIGAGLVGLGIRRRR